MLLINSSSKKYRCQNCQHKSFVKYKDNKTGDYIDGVFGRCDRESKCGYFLSPSKNRPINEKFNKVKPIQHTNLNKNVIQRFCNNYDANHFISYLINHFSDDEVANAIELYYIGTNGLWQGSTIFWQIDNQLNIRTGKVMLYNCNTGKRFKRPHPHINWMHKILKTNPFVLQQCLFGLHLIADEVTKTIICIVESEKTAIIMSIILPKYHWMATGSKSNLKIELIQPLKNYNIILYPDNSEYDDWHIKSKQLQLNNFKIICSKLLELLGEEQGADLADLLSH